MSGYEPSSIEVRLTLLLGNTLAAPVYRRYIHALDLTGQERVLDFGSGSGVCSKHLAARLQRGGHLTCLDVSHTWQAVIRKTLRRYTNVDYLVGDITKLNLPANAFDAILCHFVLHDIPAGERDGIVAEWVRVLKPGGKVFVREPIGEDGIPNAELQARLQAHGLQESKSSVTQLPLMGVTYEGVFRKA